VLWTLPAGPPTQIRALLVATGLARTLSDARRKIEEGAVEFDGAAVTDSALEVALSTSGASTLRLGRRWVQVRAGDVTAPVASPAPVPLPAASA